MVFQGRLNSLSHLLNRLNNPNLDQTLHFKTIDSSNLEAHRRRSEFSNQNVLIVADRQTAGKGQHGRQWESAPGLGLWMTLFVGRSEHLQHSMQLLSLYSGLTMQEAINSFTDIPVTLKWPNDIMINGLKCGGILTEIQWSGTNPSSVIIGIGLNVFHTLGNFPPAIRDQATSLHLAGWEAVQPSQLLEQFLDYFFGNMGLLDQPVALADTWNNHAFQLNKSVFWNDGHQTLQGDFLGIDSTGAAQIQIGNELRLYRSGEIRLAKNL